ncbi:MAG: hypothetical protein E7055_01495 [Lentisphaerae bacterium]|nr:hypothetical protein [Lentisphaerota bacterium]
MGGCASAFVEDDKRVICTRHGRTDNAQSGVPADFYEIHDFADTAGRYRCVFFFVTARTPALEDAEAYCRENRIPFLEFDGDTLVTPSGVRDFCAAGGAHCYCPDLDSGVWCGHNLAAVVALNTGIHTLRLPEKRKMTPLFAGGGPFVSDCIELNLRCGQVAAFRLDTLKETTGAIP